MSLRVPVSLLKNFPARRSTLSFYMNSQFLSKYQFTVSSNKIQTLTPDNIENIQFPKHVQPHVSHSVDEILAALNSKPVSANESVTLLKALRMFTLFKNVKSDTFKNDPRFKTLCSVFASNCHVMYPSLLISGLRSLLEVGVPPSSSCVVSAEESIINNIQSFSTFNLIGCLYFHHKFMETDLQKRVVLSLVDELCERVPEITSNAEILMLVHFLHMFKGDQRKKVEQKIVELIKMLNPHEICKMFITLGENSNRNVLILNALAFHLRQTTDSLQIKEILDIFYAFKKLNFCEIHLVMDLLNEVKREVPSVVQPSIISGFLNTCGSLRLKHDGVLNACMKWIVSHTETCRVKEFVSFILAMANLNYQTLEMQGALQKILPLISFEKIESADIWLDVVWSLAILNITDKEMLLKVLSPDFYKPLISNDESQTNKLKLMNLKAVLKNYYPECVFRCDLFLDPQEIPSSLEIQNSRKHVFNVLSNFIPKDKYLCANQNTDMGIFIDAEFIMDKNLKPQPLSEFGILSKMTPSKPLPAGAQRIALLVLFFKDYTLCTPSRTGFHDLAIRLLFSQGYTPVPISFGEFMRNNTEIKKAKFLMQKISSTMKKVEENDYKFSIKIFN